MHRGSVLPRVAVMHTREGIRLLAERPTWKEALMLGCLVTMLLGLIAIVFFVAHESRRLEGIISTVVIGSGVVEIGRRYFTRRKLKKATLLVRPWPLRLGEHVRVTFDKRLRKAAHVDSFSAKLACVEEAAASAGKYQQIMRGTRYEISLDTSRAHIESGRITDQWELDIPAEGLPSFSVKSNKIQWLVQTITETDGVEVPADFELVVIPEVAG